MPYVNPIYMRGGSDDSGMMGMDTKLARAYVPDQPYLGLFPLDEGLRKGIMFPNLYTPYPMSAVSGGGR